MHRALVEYGESRPRSGAARSTASALLVGALLMAQALAPARSDAVVMSLNPPNPTYWSGTGCEFSFEASNNTAIITGAEITINGATVYYAATMPPRVMIGETVYFDSTHFANGTPITVTATVTINVPPGTVQQSVTAPAVNKATVYGRNEWEAGGGNSAGTGVADQYLQQMNHDTSATNISLGWTESDILSALGGCTVFYVNTHGDNTCNGGDPDEFASDHDEVTNVFEWVFPSDV